MKKMLLPLVLLAALFALSGCVIGLPRFDLPVGTQPSESAGIASNTQPTEAAASGTEGLTEIINLPEELLVSVAYKGNAAWMVYPQMYGFTLEVPTELTMEGDIQKGDMELGIRSCDSKEYLFPLQEVGIQTATIVLEPGEYDLVLKGVLSDGSLRLTGAAVE